MNFLTLLDRIGIASRRADLQTLEAMQRQAMMSLPFENLDIHLGRPIRLDLSAVHDKILSGRRGGFCYELNECLFQCLTAMGYDATRVEARVRLGGSGAPFDHQCVIVNLDGRRWFTDIGFGDSTMKPLSMEHSDEQPDGRSSYRVEMREGCFEIDRRQANDGWSTMLRVNPQHQPWSGFASRCHWHQTSPGSAFTRKRLCTLATEEGRVSLSGNTLKVSGDETSEFLIEEQDYGKVLADRFGLHLESSHWRRPL